MINFVKNLKLNVKISILGAGSVLITALALVGLVVWQSRQYNQLAQNDVNNLIDADLDHITQGIYNLVETEDQAVQEQVDQNLKIALHILTNVGDITLSQETISWQATDQFTEKSIHIQLPKMFIGDEWLGQNTDKTIETPIVDDVELLIGETATIFQKMNENGDMLRVATTVTNSENHRAIGTYIPEMNPDGTTNPVIDTVMKGETYHGRAFVVDDWYLTAYEPLYDKSGNLAGMLYVGVKLENLENRVRQAILQTKVGETGYVFILRGTGEEQGHYIISKDGQRDGEDIWNSKDYDGNYFVQEMIVKALVLEPGEMDTLRYPWQNLDEPEPRWKVARLAYYEPWDWVIGISAYEDELEVYKTVLNDGRSRMTSIMILAGIIIFLLIGLAGLLMAWSIAHPIQKMTHVVETIIQGDLEKVVEIHSRDEIGVLAKAFNQMTASQRETLQALKRSEERFRSLIENSSDWICVLDKQGNFLYESPSIIRILGYEPFERIGLSIFNFLPDEELPIISKIFSEITHEENTSLQSENQLLHKNGTLQFFDIVWKNRLSDPSIQGIVLNSRDITKRKESEEELYRTSSLLRNVFDNIPSTIFVKEIKDLNYIKCNQAGLELLGLKSNEILGKKDHELFPRDQADLFVQEDQKTLEQSDILDIPEQIIQTRNKGDRIIHTKKVRLIDPNGKPEYLLGISEDITERKMAELELIRYRAHLEDEVAERTSQLTAINQELETFNYSVSHDLRAHIRAVNAYSQFLLEDENQHLNEDEKKYLNNVLNESLRMQDLIEDLMKLTQISHSTFNSKDVDLSTMVKTLLTTLEQRNTNREVECNIQEGITVKGDKGLLTIALENLVDNAWKFTSQKAVGCIDFGSLMQNEGTVYFIRDNGAGFDMKYAERMFKPFQRFHSNQDFPGTGIGLSIVRRIIERHNGKIWAESQPGEGATFFFLIK